MTNKNWNKKKNKVSFGKAYDDPDWSPYRTKRDYIPKKYTSKYVPSKEPEMELRWVGDDLKWCLKSSPLGPDDQIVVARRDS